MITNKVQKTLLFLLIIISVYTVYNISVFRKIVTTVAIDYLQDGIDIKIDNAYLIQDKNNKKEWELRSFSAQVNKTEDTTSLKDMHLQIYPDENTLLKITAKNGTVDNKTNNIAMSGDIVVNHNEYTLNTQTLRWNSSKKTIKTDDPVAILGNGFSLSGIGLSVDTTAKTLTITNKVKAVFEL